MEFNFFVAWVAALSVAFGVTGYLFFKHGYRSFIVHFIFLFLMPLLFAPFAYDKANMGAVGVDGFYHIRRSLFDAMVIFGTSVVVFFVTVLWSSSRPPRQERLIESTTFLPFYNIVTSAWVLRLMFGILTVLFVTLLGLGARYGSGIMLGFDNPVIRPVVNLWQVWCLFCLIVIPVSAFMVRRWEIWTYAALTLAMSGLTGQRAVALIPVVVAMFVIFSVRGTKFSLVPVLIASVLAPLAVLMQDFRSQVGFGTRFKDSQSIVEDMAYGNQFADFRDFSWVYGNFDQVLLMGRSYVAGYLSFIPSAIFPLRERWSYGRWTANQVGLDADTHAGLRGGAFAEVFFNFGWLGMIFVAIVVGLIVGRVIVWENRYYRSPDIRVRVASSLAAYFFIAFVFNFILSAGFFYFLIIATFLIFTSFQLRTR